MVAILRSHGISLVKTNVAYQFLADALSTTHPFVDRRLWVDDIEIAEDIYAEVDHMLVTLYQTRSNSFHGAAVDENRGSCEYDV